MKRGFLSPYLIAMVRRESTFLGGVIKIILGRIVKGCWLSAISATKRDIGSMNVIQRRGEEIISREVRFNRKIKTILEDKMINSSGEVVIVTVARDFNVSSTRDKVKRKGIELRILGYNVWEISTGERM